MTKTDYDNWSRMHVNVFGLGEAGAAMVGSWFQIFKGFGYTVAELKAATQTLAADPPQFPNQHLARVNEAIVARRQETSNRERLLRLGYQPDAPADDRGTCVSCCNSGWVIVPHPGRVHNGHWQTPGVTAAVVCGCWFGRRLIERNAKRAQESDSEVKRPMLLAEYQPLNPKWKEQLDGYERAAAEFARETGPRSGEEPRWAMLDDAIDRALTARLAMKSPSP